ncbi:MAG: hypothetical protein GY711_04310 [bacterium]|nr:hypothetical protein [bacterium]
MENGHHSGAGNFDGNTSSWSTHDLYLLPDSDAIDAGDPNASPWTRTARARTWAPTRSTRGTAGPGARLNSTDVPPSSVGYMLAGRSPGFLVHFGGSEGILCLSGDILRFSGTILQTGQSGMMSALGRFLEEAQVTGQLDHPGIVPVHELGLDAGGRVYFTMKLVKGEDLKAFFEKVQRGEDGWHLMRALGVLLKACEAMPYATSNFTDAVSVTFN